MPLKPPPFPHMILILYLFKSLLTAYMMCSIMLYCYQALWCVYFLVQHRCTIFLRSLLQVVLCQINIFCHQLTQNTMSNFVRFTQTVLKCKTQVLQVLNFRTICVNLIKSVVIFWVSWWQFFFDLTKYYHEFTIFFSWVELIQNTTYISVMPSTDSNLYAYPKVIFPVSMAQTRE